MRRRHWVCPQPGRTWEWLKFPSDRKLALDLMLSSISELCLHMWQPLRGNLRPCGTVRKGDGYSKLVSLVASLVHRLPCLSAVKTHIPDPAPHPVQPPSLSPTAHRVLNPRLPITLLILASNIGEHFLSCLGFSAPRCLCSLPCHLTSHPCLVCFQASLLSSA